MKGIAAFFSVACGAVAIFWWIFRLFNVDTVPAGLPLTFNFLQCLFLMIAVIAEDLEDYLNDNF